MSMLTLISHTTGKFELFFFYFNRISERPVDNIWSTLCIFELYQFLDLPYTVLTLLYIRVNCLKLPKPNGVHYENMHVQCTEIFSAVKNENSDIFNIFAQNVDCGYTLEPPLVLD